MKEIKKIAEKLLGRSLTSSDGIDMIDVEHTETSLGHRLPQALRDFYLLVGNVDIFMSSFEIFMEPYMKNDMIVFLEENQGVCYWAVNKRDIEVPNPPVYMCTDMEADKPEWYEEVDLVEFLKIIIYYQCAQGGYEHGSAVYEHDFENREKYVRCLGNTTKGWDKVVEHNGLTIYQEGDKLIWYFTNTHGSTGDTVFASTRTKEDMQKLESYGFAEL